MLSPEQSKTLFLLGCIPVRTLLTYLAYKIPNVHVLFLPLFLIGVSFVYLYFFNKRLNAPEAGGKTWWKNLRPIHGLFYIIAAIYALKGNNNMTSLFLGLDVVLGLSAFLLHHYS
jgi:hypothetical protein